MKRIFLLICAVMFSLSSALAGGIEGKKKKTKKKYKKKQILSILQGSQG